MVLAVEEGFLDNFSHMSEASRSSVCLYFSLFTYYPLRMWTVLLTARPSEGNQTSYLAAQGSKDIPRDRIWNLPVSSGLSPETTTVSLPQYSSGQISHRAGHIQGGTYIEFTS